MANNQPPKVVRGRRPSLKQLVIKFWESKLEVEQASADKASFQDLIIERMTAEEHERFVVEGTEYGDLHAVLVHSSTTNIDMDGLVEELDAHQMDAITEKVISKKKLEAAIAIGMIPESLVAQYVQKVDRAPYVRITPKGA